MSPVRFESGREFFMPAINPSLYTVWQVVYPVFG